ncbi:putative serine/threonine-protein kinase At1g54610 [Wolffia australiana]
MGCVLGREAASKPKNKQISPPKQISAVESAPKPEEQLDNEPKSEEIANLKPERSRKPDPRSGILPRQAYAEQIAAGWPPWLSHVAGEAIQGMVPRRADSFKKIAKIGQGTYSNVYKVRDCVTGKIVALKKVRFDNLELESVRFMAREILILKRLNHPNVVKLDGLATSRMSSSLYLIFEYMEHDLAGLAAAPGINFTEPQVKCYMHQLLSGLEHCHNNGVLHRDIKGSNLLIDNEGVLKIADFGLAITFNPNHKQPMTSRVVTLWYRPPELLLGATDYGVGVDLWSAGCILAELLAGKPIMPGRTEVEQLHKIFKLCGSPPEEYWKKSKLPHATIFKPQQPYRRCIADTFKDFPKSSLPLIETLLAIDPAERQTATDALKSEFFTTEPFACEPSSLPHYPPSKEMDVKLRDEARRASRAAKPNPDAQKRIRPRDRVPRGALPAPEANAELLANVDRRRMITHGNAKSKSEKFPPPHEDGALGFPLETSAYLDSSFDRQVADTTFSTIFPSTLNPGPGVSTWSGPLAPDPAPRPRRKKSQPSKK